MGTTYLIDTNIISKLFDGILPQNALKLLANLAITEQHISIINRIELLSWKELKGDKLNDVKLFLQEIVELDLSEEVIERTIKIRRGRSIKLPDAIIAATTIVYDLTLLSDNDKDFKTISGLKYINPTKL
jgi:predicted nucleic acid-binding protein